MTTSTSSVTLADIREIRAVFRTKRVVTAALDEVALRLTAAQGALSAQEYGAAMQHLAAMASELGNARMGVGLLSLIWPHHEGLENSEDGHDA